MKLISNNHSKFYYLSLIPANNFQTLSVDVSNPTAKPSKIEWKESDNTVTKSLSLPGPQ